MRQSWFSGILAGAVVAAVVFSFAPALRASNAQQAPERAAAVNVGTLINEYQRSKDLDEELAQLDADLKAEEEQRRAKIDQLQAEIDRLDPEDPTRVDRTRELLEMQIQYKVWGETKQAHRVREFSLWTTQIYREIIDAVKKVAEREGYDLVLYKDEFQPGSMEPQAIMEQIRGRKVLYAHPSIEITQTVLDQLNEDYRAEPHKKMLFVP
jgi:outer membrane protein